MRTDIIDHCQSEVLSRCKKPTNKFGMGCYYHIESVVQNAALLSEEFGADKEIVMIASWLHDIASVTDYSMYEEHHIYGARIAGELLKKFDYDPAKSRLSRTAFATTKEVYPSKSNLTKKSVWQTLTQFLTLTTFPVCYILPT